jgi:hypothetical protein
MTLLPEPESESLLNHRRELAPWRGQLPHGVTERHAPSRPSGGKSGGGGATETVSGVGRTHPGFRLEVGRCAVGARFGVDRRGILARPGWHQPRGRSRDSGVATPPVTGRALPKGVTTAGRTNLARPPRGRVRSAARPRSQGLTAPWPSPAARSAPGTRTPVRDS